MNELEIKRVPFMGTELMAARDADGQIWAGVRWMCVEYIQRWRPRTNMSMLIQQTNRQIHIYN